MTQGSQVTAPNNAAASSSSSSQTPMEAAAAAKAMQITSPPSRGVELIASSDGDLLGLSVSPAAQVHSIVDQFLSSPRIIALPVAQRFAVAGQIAAVPAEHARIAERLASAIGTAPTEAGALNALYFLDICRELVPGFKDLVTAERLERSAQLSAHQRVQSAVLLGQKPPEWERAAKQEPKATVVMQHQEEEPSLLDDAGRAVGDATKFVSGAALGGVGLVTDTLGLTEDAEGALVETAEDGIAPADCVCEGTPR